METLQFRFEQGSRPLAGTAQLVGVVGSGNLEVLIEPAALAGACEIEVRTAAVGFGATWQAVMTDFHARWSLADARICINDMGATPAVVSLRLDQAAQSLAGGTP
ncbi:malonate decarboxylase acyl carrier protein [Pseudoduganella albidiflava]|uniref:Malonate decarboxylase acyl carrier protein n=1 Tax=Pseudoduganella albidiflava TaxID=321983 RepID=A0A411X0Z1_9BURK|nr:malonate decarboxylase acyl carrier protein [Pseudoduganella albidiflava]QBI02608.1 malonate decarboxylase acyl carrier protein [Pseudoduganella albidiflava]GGY41384.1 malonate decarboxylase acyl carrier protein [Pseudoduganella albidiflava]